jgi:predicted nucleotidyltransferase
LGGEKMVEQIDDEISKIVKTINNVTAVNKIVLFGSFAYGNPGIESDIDLCIVTDNNLIRKRDLIKSIRRSITPVTSKAVDLLVYSEEEFNTRVKLETTLEHKIAREGITVYGQ